MRATTVDGGIVGRFLSWWGAELAACLPSPLVALFLGPTDAAEIMLSGNRLVVRLRRRSGEPPRALGEVDLGEGTRRRQAARARRLLRSAGAAAENTVLRLPEEQVLRPRIELPVASAAALRQAIAAEIDRHTPFAANDVLFDCRPAGTDGEMEKLFVDVEAARRSWIEADLERLGDLGIRPDRVAGPPRGDDTANLLPANVSPNRSRLLPRLLVGALALLAVLGIAVAASGLERKERMLARSEVLLADLTTRAGASSARRSEADALLSLSRRVAERRMSEPRAVDLLAELSERLGDSHWLTALAVRDGRLRLSGFSSDPSAVLQAIEQAPLLSAAKFEAPVTRDPRSGLDRFALSARIEPPQPGTEEAR